MEKKKKIKKIIPLCLLAVVFGIFLTWYGRATVTVQKLDEKGFLQSGFTEKTDPHYRSGYNGYGKIVFKYPKVALAQLKKEYAPGLKYLEETGMFPPISYHFEVLEQYAARGWQTPVADSVEQAEELRRQLQMISKFADQCLNSKLRTYHPALFGLGSIFGGN